LSLIQSRSSDLVSGRDPSPASSGAPTSAVGCAATDVGSDAEVARGRRAGSRRRGTNALRARGRTPETDEVRGESEPDWSRSSASAAISAAAALRTSPAKDRSLACGPADGGCVFEGSALVIKESQRRPGACPYSGSNIGAKPGAAIPCAGQARNSSEAPTIIPIGMICIGRQSRSTLGISQRLQTVA
jgi:hypothetical protein